MDYYSAPISVPRILLVFKCAQYATRLAASVNSNVHVCYPGQPPPRDGLTYDIIYMCGDFSAKTTWRAFYHNEVLPRAREDTEWFWI